MRSDFGQTTYVPFSNRSDFRQCLKYKRKCLDFDAVRSPNNYTWDTKLDHFIYVHKYKCNDPFITKMTKLS